jgi:hypothetical protein
MVTIDNTTHIVYNGDMDIQTRFWSKVNKNSSNNCWEWIGSLTKSGYGQIAINGPKYAHRLSAEWAGLNIKNRFVCHSCDNPRCVNPDHLFVGKHTDNVADMVSKGRHLKGREVSAEKNKKPIMTPFGKFNSLKDAKQTLNMNPRTLWKKLKSSNSGYYYLEKQ